MIWHYGYFFRQWIARLNWIASDKEDKDGLLVWFVNKGKLSEKLENGYKHFKTSWLQFSNDFNRDSLWLHKSLTINYGFFSGLFSIHIKCKEIVLFRVQFRSVRMCFIHIERKEIVHGQKIIKITIQDENGFRNVFDNLPLNTAVAMMLFFWDRKGVVSHLPMV